jgi:endonuclease/exonuclease/phosphatase family metal-dependent hydrolase
MRLVRWLTAAHVVGAASLWFLVWEVSESHWLGSIVTFLPRLPWLLPGAVLLIASLLARSQAFWINLATTLFVLLAVAEFNVPWQRLSASDSDAADDERTLRVVSCNVQNFAPDFSLVLREVNRAKPDVVAFQEALSPPRLLVEHFDGWHQVHVRGLWVASKWPLRLLGECQSDYFSHLSGIAVEVDAPFGPFVLADLHLMTARRSLAELRPLELVRGDSQLALAGATVERLEEARQTRAFVTEHSADRPLIVVGDFNMPTSSSVYRSSFGDLTNVFESSAWGFGFTAPCKRFRWWPHNTPWQRIDHILTNEAWQVRECRVGEWDGSDHRLIAATLRYLPFGGDSGDLRRGASR